MKSTFRVENLDNDNQYTCERCKQKVNAYMRSSIYRVPKVLTFQLRRYDSASNIKINTRTNFPPTINIQRYLSETMDGRPTAAIYELYAVLVHSGFTTTSGHYYCCLKSSNSCWYRVNDGVVSYIVHFCFLWC